MSNKFFCDICGENIDTSGSGGAYDKIKPNVDHFKNPQVHPPVIRVHQDICDKCCAVIDDAIDKRKKELTEKVK